MPRGPKYRSTVKSIPAPNHAPARASDSTSGQGRQSSKSLSSKTEIGRPCTGARAAHRRSSQRSARPLLSSRTRIAGAYSRRCRHPPLGFRAVGAEAAETHTRPTRSRIAQRYQRRRVRRARDGLQPEPRRSLQYVISHVGGPGAKLLWPILTDAGSARRRRQRGGPDLPPC